MRVYATVFLAEILRVTFETSGGILTLKLSMTWPL